MAASFVPLQGILEQYRRQPPQAGSLQERVLPELTNKLAPPLISRHLQGLPPGSPLSARDLYLLSMPKTERNQRIREIKDRCTLELKRTLLALVRKDPLNTAALLERFKPEGAFGKEMLLELYKQGKCDLDGYGCHFRSEAVRSLIAQLFDQMRSDYEKGIPHALPVISTFLNKRKITEGLPLPRTFLDQGFGSLEKMAALGVKEAQEALAWAYNENALGRDEQKIRLQFSVDQRFQGLWNLAEQGHARSQYFLGMAYFYASLGLGGKTRCSFPKEERKQAFQRLIDLESRADEFNPFVTQIYIDNPEDLFSFEERVAKLSERAKKGDRESLQNLWTLYTQNEWNKPETATIPLPLSEEERWERLNALRSSKNEEFFQNYRRHYWIWLSSPLLPCLIPIQEKLTELEKDSWSQQHVSKYYAQNQWGDTFLRIPLRQRIGKLESLAQKGCSDALKYLSSYYGLAHQNTEKIIRRDNTPEEVNYFEAPPAQMTDEPNCPSEEERAYRYLEMAIAGDPFCLQTIGDNHLTRARMGPKERKLFELLKTHLGIVDSV